MRSGSRHTPRHTVAPYSPGSLFLPPVGPHGVRSGSRPVSTRTVERIVRNAAVAAGLTDKEVNCRTLRRSYAVQCLRDGMDVETLRDSLGHKYSDPFALHSYRSLGKLSHQRGRRAVPTCLGVVRRSLTDGSPGFQGANVAPLDRRRSTCDMSV